jgi:hypothetical protein
MALADKARRSEELRVEEAERKAAVAEALVRHAEV